MRRKLKLKIYKQTIRLLFGSQNVLNVKMLIKSEARNLHVNVFCSLPGGVGVGESWREMDAKRRRWKASRDKFPN